MIGRESFSIFKQNVDSCIMATYAIGAGYFTKEPVEYYFKAYCEHYCLSYDGKLEEKVYNSHFHNVDSNGYKKIRCLHNTSNIQGFVNARKLFDVEYLPDERCRDKKTCDILKSGKACLCASCKVFDQHGEYQGAHSVIVAHDSQGLYYIDTRPEHNDIFSFQGDWPNDRYLGSVCDGLMLSGRRNATTRVK